jgi:hypothetical protein
MNITYDNQNCSLLGMDELAPELVLLIVALLDIVSLVRLRRTSKTMMAIIDGSLSSLIRKKRLNVSPDVLMLLDEKFGFEFSVDPLCELKVLSHWHLENPLTIKLISKFSNDTPNAPFLKAVLGWLQHHPLDSPIPLESAIDQKLHGEDCFFDSMMSNYNISIVFCKVHKKWEFIPRRDAKAYKRVNFMLEICCPK